MWVPSSQERIAARAATQTAVSAYELENLVTALVPSDTACLESSPGSMRRTEVWISRDESVAFLRDAPPQEVDDQGLGLSAKSGPAITSILIYIPVFTKTTLLFEVPVGGGCPRRCTVARAPVTCVASPPALLAGRAVPLARLRHSPLVLLLPPMGSLSGFDLPI